MSIAAELDTCGCCDPGEAPTPAQVENRPALSHLRYRIGTYGSFRQAMIERAAGRLELRDWTARTDDDYGMAVLDLWAYVADVLTFYQERIVNEAFIRTAVLRDSVVRLAALLGYHPAPGASADAPLAFVLERGKELTLPGGLLVQSVPGPGGKPQKFETSGPVNARAALNSLRITGLTQAASPFAAGSSAGPLKPSRAAELAETLDAGDRLVFWSESQATLEEKEVLELEERWPLTFLRWDPPIATTRTRATRFRRKLHLFGYDAPRRFIDQYVTAQGEIRVRPVNAGDNLGGPSPLDYRMGIATTNVLYLDSEYDDLTVGARLLILSRSANSTDPTVTAVRSVPVRFGPIAATVTEVTLNSNAPAIADRRDVDVYEIDSTDVELWTRSYPATISGGRVLVPLPAPALENERTVILGDGAGPPHEATVVATSLHNSDAVDGPDHLAIDISPPLQRPLDAAGAQLAGNVAQATHGETIERELLGRGDAAVPFQGFPLKDQPVSHVLSPGAPHGVESSLEVRVGDVRWTPVQSLFGRLPSDRVYTARAGDDGVPVVEFGDGKTGARPSTGAEIAARYRKGLGVAGNVPAGTLTSLLAKPPGLKGVTNPRRGAGGAERESLGQARVNAPGSVRTFGRIVSLRDFEDSALESALVAKARAGWALVHGEQVVRLTVAGDDGAQLDEAGIRALVADLDARRDPYRRLRVRAYDEIGVRVEAVIIARDPDREAADVQAAARKALIDHFAFAEREFGQPVHLSEVLAALHSAPGVVGVDVNRLQYETAADRASHGATADPVQNNMRIDAHELAAIAPADAVVVAT